MLIFCLLINVLNSLYMSGPVEHIGTWRLVPSKFLSRQSRKKSLISKFWRVKVLSSPSSNTFQRPACHADFDKICESHHFRCMMFEAQPLSLFAQKNQTGFIVRIWLDRFDSQILTKKRYGWILLSERFFCHRSLRGNTRENSKTTLKRYVGYMGFPNNTDFGIKITFFEFGWN